MATHSLTQQSREAYRSVLPEREWLALECWAETFYDFQKDWLFDPSRFAICVKSRQVGLSHTSAAVAVLWAAFLAETTTIVSIGEREALEVIDKAKRHAAALVALGSSWAKCSSKAQELKFENGGRIIALPSTSGGRGNSGNVFIDEFAYLERPDEVWDAASAVTMHGYRMRVASTPNGMGNGFARLWLESSEPLGWSRHFFDINRAIADGMSVNLDDCMKMAKGDPRLFSQLFSCGFIDGNLQYLPSESVLECSASDLYTFEGDYYAGLDIGRSNDLTVLIVVRKRPDGMRLVSYIETCKRTDSDGLEDMVARAFKRFDIKRLCVDATGMGTFPVDRMKKHHGKTRVEAVTFGLQSKEDLATGLYSAFTEGTVRIPKTDQALADCPHGSAQKLRDDLCAIRRIITSAGNVRYDAPHTDEGHADRAWSLALALHACSGPSKQRHEIIPLGEQHTRLY